MSTITPERPTTIRYSVLAWACSLSMLTYIDRVCIKQVGDSMRTDLGISAQEFAWVFSAFGLSYALLEVPSGWLGDRFGPRQVLTRIVLWWSFFTAATGAVWQFRYETNLSIPLPSAIAEFLGFGDRLLGVGVQWIPVVINSLLLLIVIRFLFGAGEAGAYPNIARAMRNWFPYAQRGFAQGLLWMFGRWGGALAPALISWIAFYCGGWRGAFVAFGVIGVVWVIWFNRYFRNAPADHPKVNAAELDLIHESKRDAQFQAPISWSTMLRNPTLWCLSFMYFCSNAGWCFFITWDVEYYKQVLGLERDSIELTIASGAPLFFGGIACLLGGFVTDRQVKLWGRRWGRTLQGAAAYALGGIFFLLALLTREPLLAVPSLCIASFLKDFAMAVSWSTCIDIGHRYSGTVAGFMNMVGNLGTFFAPPIVAAMARQGQWERALIFSGTMFLIASICWLFVNPRHVIVYTPEDHAKLQAAT